MTEQIAPFQNYTQLSRFEFPTPESSLSTFLSDASSGGTVTANPDSITLSTGTTSDNTARLQSTNIDVSNVDAIAVQTITKIDSVPNNAHVGLTNNGTNEIVRKLAVGNSGGATTTLIRNGSDTDYVDRTAQPTKRIPVSVIVDFESSESTTFTTQALGAKASEIPDVTEMGIDVFLKTNSSTDYTMQIYNLVIETYRKR